MKKLSGTSLNSSINTSPIPSVDPHQYPHREQIEISLKEPRRRTLELFVANSILRVPNLSLSSQLSLRPQNFRSQGSSENHFEKRIIFEFRNGLSP
jgi:hypothetical protein